MTFEETFSPVFTKTSRDLERFQRLKQQLSRRSKGEGKEKVCKISRASLLSSPQCRNLSLISKM